MLEKIGLPAKPSLRGNTWVVDASHCQSCSSQFTFLNRKHHCRRCGGIFCNNCTLNRMVLRGQGDSPVRVCEACKKQEEAARFEMRYGHKNRAGKGTSKSASRSVDEVLNDLLVNNGKESARLGSGKEIASQDDEADMLASASDGTNSEADSLTPEELRQQSLEEKNKYKILKGEGKSAEALKAFKRSRELERQAAALELQLRKNKKKALATRSSAKTQKDQETSELSTRGKPSKVKEKDDLTAELKELGWSEMDIHDADKKPAPTSVEGELLSLIQGSSQTSHKKESSSGLDKSEVIALKRKALMLKREGKLAEAKEELKRAKILEKQLEEQELLAEADDSDDELSALMRSLDKDDKKDFSFSSGFDVDSAFDLDSFSAFGGDFDIDGNFEATDDDLHDPEMVAALQSLGWTEEPILFYDIVPQSSSVDRGALSDEILKLKKEAVSQKRSGNMAEAMSLLKRAKALEKDLEKIEDKEPESGGLHSRSSDIIPNTHRKSPAKSRLMIQKELLAVKKKALALRREGKLEEAESELNKGKALEQQLEEIDNPTKMDTHIDVGNASEPLVEDLDLSSMVAYEDEQDDVTDQDLHDPSYLSLLETLGWQEDDNHSVMNSSDMPDRKAAVPVETKDTTTSVSNNTVKKRRSKTEIQRELLGLKRKALALRRQGQEIEADEVLANAKILEEELAELEAPKVRLTANFTETKVDIAASIQDNLPENIEPIDRGTQQTPLKRPAEANDALEKRQVVQTPIDGANFSPNVSPDKQKSPVQQEILSHKRKALALKKEGKLAEAKEELRKAKLLERSLEDSTSPSPVETSSVLSYTAKEEQGTSTSVAKEEQDPPQVVPKKPMSSSERLKLQRECLNHKRNAMKLRREGRTEEAEAELGIANNLEAQLEEVSPSNPTGPASAGSPDDTLIEDLFDPQLLSALTAIGLHDANVGSHTLAKTNLTKSNSIVNETSNQERVQLEVQIKSEKVKALNLKRAGKQAEALEALRWAKQMEKKLNSMPA